MESESTEPTNGPSTAASPEAHVDWRENHAGSFLVILAFVFAVSGLVLHDTSAGKPRLESPPASARHKAAFGSLLDILNTADADELARLPGIGPVLARRIVERRPFHSMEELARVPGIGPKVVLRLKVLFGEEGQSPRRN